jgi:hypothetical protein
MATFDQHCRDCERLLGDRHETVNHWMDEFFRKFGPHHRRFRHHWDGVREARVLFGDAGATAAIVHIVRDCGEVPKRRDYGKKVDEFGIIELCPESLLYDGLTETAREKFDKVVQAEIKKFQAQNAESRI